ncbi:hypothetical protein RIF29_29963 [Crotalaria pallida]|uniref:Uncharacterized protein n=1 Tax=Crotalaria pallida TaxID=3830 RepID=A0AAN9EFQ9_CROPI
MPEPPPNFNPFNNSEPDFLLQPLPDFEPFSEEDCFMIQDFLSQPLPSQEPPVEQEFHLPPFPPLEPNTQYLVGTTLGDAFLVPYFDPMDILSPLPPQQQPLSDHQVPLTINPHNLSHAPPTVEQIDSNPAMPDFAEWLEEQAVMEVDTTPAVLPPPQPLPPPAAKPQEQIDSNASMPDFAEWLKEQSAMTVDTTPAVLPPPLPAAKPQAVFHHGASSSKPRSQSWLYSVPNVDQSELAPHPAFSKGISNMVVSSSAQGQIQKSSSEEGAAKTTPTTTVSSPDFTEFEEWITKSEPATVVSPDFHDWIEEEWNEHLLKSGKATPISPPRVIAPTPPSSTNPPPPPATNVVESEGKRPKKIPRLISSGYEEQSTHADGTNEFGVSYKESLDILNSIRTPGSKRNLRPVIINLSCNEDIVEKIMSVEGTIMYVIGAVGSLSDVQLLQSGKPTTYKLSIS